MAKILDMADEQQMVLRTEDLVKKYKTRTVVNHVSINVKQGEIVGLLGPNGAGKTTTFYMTVGLVARAPAAAAPPIAPSARPDAPCRRPSRAVRVRNRRFPAWRFLSFEKLMVPQGSRRTGPPSCKGRPIATRTSEPDRRPERRR